MESTRFLRVPSIHFPQTGREPRFSFPYLARISHTFSSRSGGRAGLTRRADPQAGTPGPRKRTVGYVEEADGAQHSQDRIIAPMQ